MIKNKKGFTLIELIIVMAIIGILAVVAVIAIGSKSADARDARRLADMATIRTSLALHCSEQETTTLTVTSSTTPLVNTTAPSNYLPFSQINDPSGTAACTTSSVDVCNYAYGDPTSSGDPFGVATTSINSCDYHINFFEEGDNGLGYASDEGLVQ